MTYSPLDIRMIEIFGKKELTFGCLIKYGDSYMQYSHEGSNYYIFVDGQSTGVIEKSSKDKIEILGHIPHLEDIFRVANEKLGTNFESLVNMNRITFCSRMGTIELSYNPALPPLKQSEETKQALVDLFS